MISDRNPLAGNWKLSYLYYFFQGIPVIEPYLQICWHPEGSGRFPEACPEAYASSRVSLQFRKVPEGFRKLVRKLVSYFSLFPQFRKRPEGFRKLVWKLVCSVCSPAFRKIPEGFRKTDGKGYKVSSHGFGVCKWRKLAALNSMHVSECLGWAAGWYHGSEFMWKLSHEIVHCADNLLWYASTCYTIQVMQQFQISSNYDCL